MKTLKIIPNIVLIIILTVSCRDFFEMSIDLDVPEHVSKLAVTALMNNSSGENNVLVSFSQGITKDASNNQLINNADVVLSDGTNDINFTLSNIEGVYTPNSEIIFEMNKTYSLSVSTPQYSEVTAIQKLPTVIPITKVTFDSSKLRVQFKDIANQKNYYLLELFHLDDESDFYESTGIYTFGESSYWSAFSNGILFKDTNFNGEQTEMIAEHYFSSEPNTTHHFKAVLHHTSEDYYRYDRSFSLSEEADGNPFVEPVILHKNFDNGYGVFSLMNKSEIEFDYTTP